jgi:hypothetical protein
MDAGKKMLSNGKIVIQSDLKKNNTGSEVFIYK